MKDKVLKGSILTGAIAIGLAGYFGTTSAQPLITATREAEVSAWQASKTEDIRAAQNSYHRKHGRYFQLLATGDATRASASERRIPSDEPHPEDINLDLGVVPTNVAIYSHERGEGDGYSLVYTMQRGGKLYKKIVGFGEVNNGSYDWREITE